MDLHPDTIRRVDETVAVTQSRGQVPSLVAGVVRAGELVHVTGAGELPPPDTDMQYRIGSITKTFTAALVLALRDEGLLSLDDLLYRHLPGTPLGGITLRQILGHHSGLQREPDGDWWERSPGTGLDEFLAALHADKAAYPPHRSHHYSNIGYGLLGAVLTRVTGQPWWSLVADRLLKPLGMTRTTYQATEPFARGFVVHPWHGTLREEPRHDAGAMAPAGQLWSTVADLVKWAAFLADPDPGVLSRATVAEMCAPAAIIDPDGWTGAAGLGLELWRHGERIYVGHTGSMPGYLAALVVHRPTRTGVVAFANAYRLAGSRLGMVAIDLLTEIVEREPVRAPVWRPGAVPPAEVEPLTGRWWWMGVEVQVSWDATSRELVAQMVGAPVQPWRFTPDGHDRWRGRSGLNDGEILQVRRGRGGAIVALDVATFVFTRDPWPDPVP